MLLRECIGALLVELPVRTKRNRSAQAAPFDLEAAIVEEIPTLERRRSERLLQVPLRFPHGTFGADRKGATSASMDRLLQSVEVAGSRHRSQHRAGLALD